MIKEEKKERKLNRLIFKSDALTKSNLSMPVPITFLLESKDL
jgi:hypothetical protein